MTAGPYARIREDLPWGWWLRAGALGLEDDQGVIWPNVRAAFWEGRLGMRDSHHATEQTELMLRVLVDLDASGIPSNVIEHLFDGDTFFWRFYMNWLGSTGMTVIPEGGTASDSYLSAEGRAVMLMLLATREPEWVDLPMQELIDAVRRAPRDAAHDAREAALQAFERGLTPLPHIFARERVGSSYLVTLTSIDPFARMPVRRVVWSVSFKDPNVRDDLFGWLATRVHRWDALGAMAYRSGSRALSANLLSMFVAEPIDRGRNHAKDHTA